MDEETEVITEAALSEKSRNQTAKRAAQILLSSNAGFVVPTVKQKRLLLVEFAKRNLVVYGKAFDVVKLAGALNLDDATEVERNLDKIVLCEIKSSNRKLPKDFKGYFFALTTAELLVAQNLKQRFKFILVNTTTASYIELTLQELFGRARGIYPTWSIMF
ncbi:MAG: hypothetical protein WBM04_08650 [Candidatus Korobacteraceae bacterium]